jgi:hypothetical protein
MDTEQFDRLARDVNRAGTRRGALRLLWSGALAGAGVVLGLNVAQPARAQSCLGDGARCSDAAECCSSWCKRKHGSHKKFCRRAENQGICSGADNKCTSGSVVCGTNSTGDGCPCFVTTAGRSFCGAGSVVEADDCGCTGDKQCEQRIGKGAKCVQVEGVCAALCPSGTTTGCLAPCPNLFTFS